MDPRTSILRAGHHSAHPLSSHRTAGPFSLQSEYTPFPCPYCDKGFHSINRQARHISQTDCQDRQEATLVAERVRRRIQVDLGIANDDHRASKRVRFTENAVPLSEEVPSPSLSQISEVSCANSDAATSNLHEELGRNEATSDHSNSSTLPHSLVTHNGGHTYIENYPDPLAGSPINETTTPAFDLRSYLRDVGPLSDLEDFNTLELLMTIGLTNKGRDHMLKSRKYRGQTPWRNCEQMLKDLDKLPHGPSWKMYEIAIKTLNGPARVEYLFGRNILEVIRSLIGDWTFRDELHYSPTRVWTTKQRKEQVYGEAWTGKWWWRMQIMIPDKFATIVPLIIATDKTQLWVMCGGQEAYPVYLTIGNLPKSIRCKVSRRATVLLGYLPVDSFPEVKDRDERARLRHKLTHDALAILLEPLRKAAKDGVVMTCADGRQRRIYPIPAAFEGDWPEQCGMACADEGGCPICEQVFELRSDYPNQAPQRCPNGTLAALRSYFKNEKDPGELKPLRLKPWWPWWASIPYTNFHASIMPDLLHQLYQGMIKTHVIAWTKKVVGVHIVDKCFRAMPGAVGLRHFTRGINRIPGSRWTGRESKEAAKQLLLVVAGQHSIKPSFVSLVRSVVDFTYRAHKSQMSEGDIQRLERALGEFHNEKPVLVALGIYSSVDGLNWVRKLHMLTHYSSAIREMGTPDGYNTESPEHLHIIYAKRGWRASSKVRPLPQMVKFIQRYEAIRIHHRSLVDEDEQPGEVSERVNEAPDEGEEEETNGETSKDGFEHESDLVRLCRTNSIGPQVLLDPEWSIAVKPTVSCLNCDAITERYGALEFIPRINEWLDEWSAVGLLPAVQYVTDGHKFDIWHKFYLHHRPLCFDPDLPTRRDTIRAHPPLPVPGSSLLPVGHGTFDTVLFLAKPDEIGIRRYRAGRIHVIFKLPNHLSTAYPHPLVYLELFTPFSKDFSTSHHMHTISHDTHRGIRRTIVMPLFWVVAACHLAPVFSQFDADFPFDCDDVLSIGKEFFFNHYSSNFMFGLVDQWRTIQDRIDEAKAAERRAVEEEAQRARAARGKAARMRLVQRRNVMDSLSH